MCCRCFFWKIYLVVWVCVCHPPLSSRISKRTQSSIPHATCHLSFWRERFLKTEFFLHNALIICLDGTPLAFPSHRFYVRAAVARGGGRLCGQEGLWRERQWCLRSPSVRGVALRIIEFTAVVSIVFSDLIERFREFRKAREKPWKTGDSCILRPESFIRRPIRFQQVKKFISIKSRFSWGKEGSEYYANQMTKVIN